LDDAEAKLLQREYEALGRWLYERCSNAPGAISMMALAEVLALTISWRCRHDDEATTCSFVDSVADNIKQTVRRLKAVPADAGEILH
jgi:predicted MarR family transcription regulator